MIEDGQLLFDRMSDPLVVMELIVCKCNRTLFDPEQSVPRTQLEY